MNGPRAEHVWRRAVAAWTQIVRHPGDTCDVMFGLASVKVDLLVRNSSSLYISTSAIVRSEHGAVASTAKLVLSRRGQRRHMLPAVADCGEADPAARCWRTACDSASVFLLAPDFA